MPAPRVEKYVDLISVPDQADQDMIAFWVGLRPRSLNYWLGNLGKAREFAAETAQDESFVRHDREPSSKEIEILRPAS